VIPSATGAVYAPCLPASAGAQTVHVHSCTSGRRFGLPRRRDATEEERVDDARRPRRRHRRRLRRLDDLQDCGVPGPGDPETSGERGDPSARLGRGNAALGQPSKLVDEPGMNRCPHDPTVAADLGRFCAESVTINVVH